MSWRPPSAESNPNSQYDALHEGVPGWLWSSLRQWVRGRLLHRVPVGRYAGGQTKYREDYQIGWIRELERKVRVVVGEGTDAAVLNELLNVANTDPEKFIDAVAFLLTKEPKAAPSLAVLLDEGGSAWRVVERDGELFLERRVDSTVSTAVDTTIAASGKAGQYLADAWHALYGRDPSPSEAYRDAVRAVEVAAIPIVTPLNQRATLGTIIPALRDGASNFRCILAPTTGDALTAVVSMLELLWRSQLDRHGSPDPAGQYKATTEEAEAAVHLAATLVQWFAGGVVTRR